MALTEPEDTRRYSRLPMTKTLRGPAAQGPLVSVVTPCLDPGWRLKRCIDSVRGQSYPHIEHLVIDGGSTDGTVELLRRTDGIRFVSEADEGQADAINKGFEMAQGEIVGWLNADDILTPDAVASVVEAFTSQQIGWTIGDVVVVSSSDAQVETPARPERPGTWRARSVAPQPGSFLSRAALDEVGSLDPSFQFTMDLDLWLRLIDAGIPYAYVKEVLAVFEVHSSSKSGSVSHAAFLVEDARARYKNGRIEDAAFGVGRAIAWKVDEGLSRDDAEVGSVTETGDLPGLQRSVEVGFRTERAILAVKQKDILAAIPILSPRLWLHAGARSRLLHVFHRTLTSRRRRRQASPFVNLLRSS